MFCIMRLIYKYIVRQLFLGILITTLSLTTIIWLTQSLNLIEFIVNNGLPVKIFFKLTMLLLPTFLVLIIPIASFVVTLFIYNKLISDREIAVMRASGLSSFSIAKPAIYLSLFFFLFNLFLSLKVVPYSVKSFKELQFNIRNDLTSLLFHEGEFTNIGKGLSVFIKERGADGSLTGIMVFDETNPKKQIKWIAQKGMLVHDEKGPKVVMIKGTRQEINPQTKEFSLLYFDRNTFDFSEIAQTSDIRHRESRELSLSELLNPPNITTESDKKKFIIEAQKRFIVPIYNIAFTLIALAGTLIGSFSRRGQSKAVIVTIICFIIVQGLAIGLENAALANLNLIPLMYLNLFTSIIISVLLLKYYNPSSFLKHKTGT